MTTKKPQTRKPAAAKRSTRPAKKPAPAAQGSRVKFGPTQCHAPGCRGERYLKGSLLCREHQAAWAAGTFRLSQRGWDRLRARQAAGKPAARRARARGRAA